MWHGGGWYGYLRSGDDKPQKVTKELLLRVLEYARPYWNHISGMLVTILFTTGLSLISPLIFRHLIDTILPSKDVNGLLLFALALLLVPLVTGGINVIQRRLNATVGEGVIYDLRVSLFSRLQRMSLRFFTNTKVGELMSRLNNDVVGAQNAISNTIVGIVTNIIQTVAILAVMLTLEWRLTLVSVLILPLFILAARRLGLVLRDIARRAMDPGLSSPVRPGWPIMAAQPAHALQKHVGRGEFGDEQVGIDIDALLDDLRCDEDAARRARAILAEFFHPDRFDFGAAVGGEAGVEHTGLKGTFPAASVDLAEDLLALRNGIDNPEDAKPLLRHRDGTIKQSIRSSRNVFEPDALFRRNGRRDDLG